LDPEEPETEAAYPSASKATNKQYFRRSETEAFLWCTATGKGQLRAESCVLQHEAASLFLKLALVASLHCLAFLELLQSKKKKKRLDLSFLGNKH